MQYMNKIFTIGSQRFSDKKSLIFLGKSSTKKIGILININNNNINKDKRFGFNEMLFYQPCCKNQLNINW